MENSGFVIKQREFLIMLTLYEDENYQVTGIRVENLLAQLAENKTRWFKVGREGSHKDFRKSLRWDLSRLKQEGYLRGKGEGLYVMGNDFEENFKSVVADLYNYLDIELEGDLDFIDSDEERERVLIGIENGEIWVNSIVGIDNKTVSMLTDEQINKLGKLAVLFGIAC